MAQTKELDSILVVAIAAAGIYFLWKLFAGNKGGGSSGTTAMGNRYTVNADGSLTLNFRGADETFQLTAAVGPTGQTMSALLDSGWSYGDVADMILTSQENVFASNP